MSAAHLQILTRTLTPTQTPTQTRTYQVSAARVLSLEGYPGIFQTPPRHARALAALVTPEGQRRLKFVVGLRDPLALGFSLWSFQVRARGLGG